MKSWCCCVIFSWFWLVVTSDATPPPCETPHGEPGSCIYLWKCPVLQGATLNKFACGKTTDYTFCCRNEIETTTAPPKETKKEENLRLLSNAITKQHCGYPHTDDWGDFSYNETEIQVYEFPWLVYIPLTDYLPDLHLVRKEKNCVGVLISPRHVLTDIDCKGNSVILGLHSTDEDVSCITTPYVTADKDCTRPLIVENIDKNLTLPDSRIMLLRLRKKITYTDYIRPACLPLNVSKPPPQENDIVITSGWGADDYTDGRVTKIKKRIKHSLMKNEDCEYGNDISSPVCGMTLVDNDFVCPGDNGGPLVYQHPKKTDNRPKKRNWFVLGIITGRTDCDERQPVVAEGINPKKLNWLLENMDT